MLNRDNSQENFSCLLCFETPRYVHCYIVTHANESCHQRRKNAGIVVGYDHIPLQTMAMAWRHFSTGLCV